MKQLSTIEALKEMLPNTRGVDVAILYGSFGRNEATPNSDIDIQLIVNKDFEPGNLIFQLGQLFQCKIQTVREIAMRNKIVVYFKSEPKIEFAICTEISEIDRNYLGSEIADIEQTILYEKLPQVLDIHSYLKTLTENHRNKELLLNIDKQIDELIDKFVYEFESCSSLHRRSDSYQFYFFYNIALHTAVQLNSISKGESKFIFLPKYFTSNILFRVEQEAFYNLKGTLFLPEANQLKRRLLDFFYDVITKVVSELKLNKVKQFCEWIYDRDFLWNFRDVSTHNPKIKSGKIFRTATMTFLQDHKAFDELLLKNQIKTVIDLRADREINEFPYCEQALLKFKYINAQFDPWNQPEWFKKAHHHGTNDEIAYRYFAVGCTGEIKRAIEAIINEEEGAVAVHCFAGKDRTGIFVSLLHLLTEAPIEAIYADYLASEVDVKLSRLNILLDIIKEKGGIHAYLNSCGLTQDQIIKLKQKLIN